MGKIKVTNNTEVLEIEPSDLKDALKDGYRQVQTIPVTNGKEVLYIDDTDLEDAIKDGYVKKKDDSNTGATSLGNGSLPTPEDEKISIVSLEKEGKIPEASDDIGLALQAKELSNKKGEVGFGMGTKITPDENGIGQAEEIKKYLKDKGIDADELANEFSDYPMSAKDSPANPTNEEWIELRQKNPIKYKQLLNEVKNKHAVGNAAKKSFKENSLDNETDIDYKANQTGIITANDYNVMNDDIAKSPEDFFNVIRHKQDLISNNLSGEDKNKALGRLAETYSQYVTPETVQKEYEQSDLNNQLDVRQFAGLKTLQLFEPEKYEQALNILKAKITPTYDVAVEGVQAPVAAGGKFQTTDAAQAKKMGGKLSGETIDEQIGQEGVLRELSDIGRNNTITRLTDEQHSLNNDFENTDDENERQLIQQKYLQNQEQINNINEISKQDDVRFPLTAKLKFDNQVKEITQQTGISPLNYGALRFAKGVGEGTNSFEDMFVNTFGSDKDKALLQAKRLGEGKSFESESYLPENLKSTGSPVILQPTKQLKEAVDKIVNGRKLGELPFEDKEKITNLIRDNQDQIQTITNPKEGKSKNFFSKATLYSNAGFTGDIAAFLYKTAGLKSIGLPSKAAELTTLYNDGYNAAYNQAVEEGKSSSAANQRGILHGAVMTLAGTVSSKFDAVKEMLGASKSPVSKEILGLGEKGWDAIVNKNKGVISRIENAAGKVLKENAKMIGTYGVGVSIANDLVDKGFFNKEITTDEMINHAAESAKEMAIGSVALAGAGFLSHVSKTPVTLRDKATIWEIGDNPDISIAKIDEQVAQNKITPIEAEAKKKAINEVAGLIQKVPELTDKGKPMTDQQKVEYLYNSVLKNKSTEAAKDLPPKQAEVAQKTGDIAAYKNAIILDNPTSTQLESRQKKLENILEPKKDSEGKVIEIPEQEKLAAEAELDAVKDAIQEKSAQAADENIKKHTDTKLSQPIEGVDEQGVPLNAEPEIKANEEKIKTEIPVSETTTGSTEANEPIPSEETSTPKEGNGEIVQPPKEPTKPVEESEGGKFNDKGILNRLADAENIPEQAKEGFKEKGLKYEVQSSKEAEEIGKAMVDQYGIDDAVILAEANKFKGGVNSAIFADSLNRLADAESKAKTPQEKIDAAKKFAEVGIRYDEFARNQGRDISQIGLFYKKSPLGIQLMENAKRKEDFDSWSKPKEKSWKEFFDEMTKEPEFDAIIKEQVKSELKEERKKARESRIKKVDDFFDKAKDEFKGGAAYSMIIPPKVITTALEGMKKAYHAGEKVAKLVEDAIDYISGELGGASWDKEKFRKEWQEKLKDSNRKTLTDEEAKAKILDRFRKKLKGLSERQKEDVIRKSFKQIVENGGLDYADFRKIISDVTGRGEMTESEAATLKKLVEKTNAVDAAAKRVMTERTPQSIKDFDKAELEAGKAQRELATLLNNRPNITKRLTSMLQLNTLGIAALVNNPIYNVWNQTTLRLPVGAVNTLLDKGIKKVAGLLGKKYNVETDISSVKVQKEFFKKLGLGAKEAGTQFFTGLNRMDYIQKEIQSDQIRPLEAAKDLWDYKQGKINLSGKQIIDKVLQAQPTGITAEIVARTLNLGDKPQRYAAEGAQAATFAKNLGLKDIDYDIFIKFPREEAYRKYKEQGLSDAEAAKKADYIKDTIIKEGQRSTFQQDNMLNDVLNKVFGGEQSGVGQLAKAVLVSPYLKIPANAYWSFYNIVNPEVAVLQSMIYGAKAAAKKYGNKTRFIGDKDNTSAAKDLHEARYWFAHAAVGIATRAVVVSLVSAGIIRPSNDEDNTKKEREGEQNYEQQGSINVSKLDALMRGENPDDVKNGLVVQNRWFGHWGTVANAIAKKNEDMTPEQKEKQDEFWNLAMSGMELSALKELEQGVFGNTSSLLGALGEGAKSGSVGYGLKSWGMNTMNMFTNIVHPATYAQISKAQLPYYTKKKADTFLGELKNNMLERSSVIRKLSGQYPPSKVGIWGDRLDKKDNTIMRLFGISRANDDNFAQPIYEDYKKTNDTRFFPSAVKPEINKQKLNTQQATDLETFVGQERKKLAAPYMNDGATFEGSNKKYSQLSDEEKIKKLQIIYEQGMKNGKDLFLVKYPQFKEPTKTSTDKRQESKKSSQNETFRNRLIKK